MATAHNIHVFPLLSANPRDGVMGHGVLVSRVFAVLTASYQVAVYTDRCYSINENKTKPTCH